MTRCHTVLLTLCCLTLCLVLGGGTARAQLQYGQMQGTVTNRDSHRPLAGVTVVVTGPALQGDSTEFTDKRGYFLITELPPGDNYVVRFYFNDVVVERPNIRLNQNTTLTVNVPMPMSRGERKAYVIHERAPNVDTAQATTGVEINQELLQNTATHGRTFESIVSLAPGAADVSPRRVAGGDVGVSFGGTSGNESAYIIDGLNTTDLNGGTAATQLNLNFIKEVSVITGGYQAEYGGATGAVVSVITKSGSNEFHGSVFGSVLPWQAPARAVSRLGEAIAASVRTNYQYDAGFELGGPIVRDKIWFYVGFAPTITSTFIDRSIRVQLNQSDPNYRDPDYLTSPVLTEQARMLARPTVEVPGRTRRLEETSQLYNWIAKLQINLHRDHSLTLSYLGAPEYKHPYEIHGLSYDGRGASFSSNVDAMGYSSNHQFHDMMARYIGKFLQNKLQVDVLYGFHYELLEELPDSDSKQQIRYHAPPSAAYSLADFENIPECKRMTVNGQIFNPCPVTDYITNGFGQYIPRRQTMRHALVASATYYLSLLGNHAIKLGFNFEDNLQDNTKRYTGTDFQAGDPTSGRLTWDTNATGTGLRINRGYAEGSPIDLYGRQGILCAPGRYCFPDFRAETQTRNYALYLRDSWNVSFIPGLVVNAGLRWEAQEVLGTDDQVHIGLYDNLAPRAGLAYDFTRKGRSKLYANYGRFYESIPMDINDRSFSTEGFLRGTGFATDCAKQPLVPGGLPLPVPGMGCTLAQPRLSGGSIEPVAPGIKGQYQDEVVAGIQYDIGWDIVVGAYYTYRTLGNIIEDLSVDGGSSYFIANPGVSASPDQLQKLQDEVSKAMAAAAANPNNAQLQSAASFARDRLNVTKANVLFPTAKREYQAATFTVTKRLSNRFSVLANYTYSRLYGNYPGLFSPFNNQLDPNLSSQFDIIDLTVNRNGPLNNDRPHNLKMTGFYMQPVGRHGTLTASLTFSLISGRPIQVLGAHVSYGPRQVLILPSGAAGRTPIITQLDLHLGYEHVLPRNMRLSVFVDVVNLLDQQQVTNVDDEYTTSIVNPILYGRPGDLKNLTTNDGAPLVVNSNYGQPTAFQAPLYLRFGGRLAF